MKLYHLNDGGRITDQTLKCEGCGEIVDNTDEWMKEPPRYVQHHYGDACLGGHGARPVEWYRGYR